MPDLAEVEHRLTLARIAAERLRKRIQEESRGVWRALRLYRRTKHLATRLLRQAAERETEAMRLSREMQTYRAEVNELRRMLTAIGLRADPERMRRVRAELDRLTRTVETWRPHD
jgi:hypothetical protein